MNKPHLNSLLADELRLVGPTRRSSLSRMLIIAITALLLSTPNFAFAEAVWEEVDGGGNVIVHMNVTPADEPTPAFKYRLTLRPHELVPGNSVAHYMRSFPEGGIARTWRFVRDEFGEEVEDWYGTYIPISKLPMDKFVAAAAPFEGMIRNYIEPGSRCRETDWGVSFVDVKGPDVIAFLLPEIQSMRSMCRALLLRTRLAIAEYRYDDAIELLRMNYRLGRDVGKQPILVSGLVGIAIHGNTNNTATDLIASENSPNLYWALTEMPRPQVSLRNALRLEMAIGPRMFECLDDPESKTLSHEEWNALWKRSGKIAREVASMEDFNSLPDNAFTPMLNGLLGYSHAKKRLVAWGFSEKKVEAMAVGQVLSIYSARVYHLLADEYEKAGYLSFKDSKRLGRKANEAIENADPLGSSPDREIIPIASMLLPAVQAARSASFRIERDLDALRVIEALRMHAARNDAKWPATLEDITCVPVPDNIATGEPFEYRVEGDKAILLLPMSDGFHIQRQYELTIDTK